MSRRSTKELIAPYVGGRSMATAASAPSAAVTPPAEELSSSSGWRSRLRSMNLIGFAQTGGLFAAVVVLSLVFDGMNSAFLSTGNLWSIVEAATALTIVAFGEMAVLLLGEIDLSVGAVYGLGAMIVGLLWMHGVPFVLALIIGLLMGAAAGVINGLLVVKVGLNSFIVTLGMLNICEGVDYLVSNSESIDPSTSLGQYSVFKAFGADHLGSVPIQGVWLLAIAVVMFVLTHRTKLGFHGAAIGGNRNAAKIAKLRVSWYVVGAFVLSGVLAVLAGVISFSQVGATDPTSGANLPFTVFAAVILGGSSLLGGRASVIGTFLGAFFLTIITNGLTLLGYGSFFQLTFVGVIIVVAVLLDRLVQVKRGLSTGGVQW